MPYIDGIAHEDRSILLASASDKLHNARSIVRYLHAMGENLWQKFNVPKECTLWDYREVVTAFRLNPVHQKELVNKHERIVAEMERLGGVAPAAAGYAEHRPPPAGECSDRSWWAVGASGFDRAVPDRIRSRQAGPSTAASKSGQSSTVGEAALPPEHPPVEGQIRRRCRRRRVDLLRKSGMLTSPPPEPHGLNNVTHVGARPLAPTTLTFLSTRSHPSLLSPNPGPGLRVNARVGRTWSSTCHSVDPSPGQAYTLGSDPRGSTCPASEGRRH